MPPSSLNAVVIINPNFHSVNGQASGRPPPGMILPLWEQYSRIGFSIWERTGLRFVFPKSVKTRRSAKEKNVPEEHKGEVGYGDVWTWTAIDADTKLVPCWHVGSRDGRDAWDFICNLRSRLASRVQLSTDGHRVYLEAIDAAFGADIDYAMLIKIYGHETREGQRR